MLKIRSIYLVAQVIMSFGTFETNLITTAKKLITVKTLTPKQKTSCSVLSVVK